MNRVLIRVCLVACCALGCGGWIGGAFAAAVPATVPAVVPDLPAAKQLEPGVLFYEVKLPKAGSPDNKLWIYLPEEKTPGKKPACILVAPAGTRMFHGNSLDDSARPEHLPYVRAGFAVVAYELDGPLAEDASDEGIVTSAILFKKAEAGLVNASLALDYIGKKVPQIDSTRIITAGHSSAGTTSLLVAGRDPRVRACVAYAPETDVEKALGPKSVAFLCKLMPDYQAFLARTSPHAGAKNLRCPLFLFHAEDDTCIDVAESAAFAKEVGKNNPAVVFVKVAKGGHYDAMVNEGIPRAIAWIKSLK